MSVSMESQGRARFSRRCRGRTPGAFASRGWGGGGGGGGSPEPRCPRFLLGSVTRAQRLQGHHSTHPTKQCDAASPEKWTEHHTERFICERSRARKIASHCTLPLRRNSRKFELVYYDKTSGFPRAEGRGRESVQRTAKNLLGTREMFVTLMVVMASHAYFILNYP